jgi:hypothetical protein
MTPILQAAVSILREHAAGRSVDPGRLDWALRTVEMFAPVHHKTQLLEADHA